MTTTTDDILDGFPTSDAAWELDSIFAGGAESASFDDAVQALENEAAAMFGRLDQLDDPSNVARLSDAAVEAWVAFFEAVEALQDRATQASAFASCMAAAHTDQPAAMQLPLRLNEVSSRLRSLRVELQARFRDIDDAVFSQLVDHPDLSRCRLYLEELRREARRHMEPTLEGLAVELNRDGLHAWGQLYDRISGQLEVTVGATDGPGERQVSVGQAKNLGDHPDRAVRRQAFEGLQRAWAGQTPTLAMVLNSIIGAERTLYTRRGGDELTAALDANRVRRETVEAMLEAAGDFQGVLVDYMQAKAELLGVETLAWYDLRAPVGGADDDEISYEQAQRFIVEQVGEFSAPMGQFYRRALANQWVEAADRPAKAQGGFCTGFPVAGQTRIFMTYGRSTSGVQTLAHELGHAYHGWKMRELGAFERDIPMGLAETASTLSEALVESAALERAEGTKKLRLLDERLQRGAAFLVNIPARFELERAMHRARGRGELDGAQLSDMTVDIFSRAYGDGVDGVDPTFWASKLHFYITGLPFYNFPYTFGYLFSQAVHQRLGTGAAAAADIDALLVDTGRLTAEEIGRRHLDADLGDPDFWRQAAGSVRQDVADFTAISGQLLQD